MADIVHPAEAVSALLAAFTRDTAFLKQHRAELLEQYRNQWIAIYDGAVVERASQLRPLLDALAKRGMAQRAVIEFMSGKDPAYLTLRFAS